MATKKKCQQYNVEYLKFGFIPSPSNYQRPMCLICKSVFSNEAMKPSRLQEHLTTKHPYKANSNLSYFQGLREQHSKRTTVVSLFKKTNIICERGQKASYALSLLIAKTGKPHTIGETLIKPAVKEVIKTVLNQDPTEVLSAVPLSNDTVTRRIDEMGQNVEMQLCEELETTHFSIQLDESTLRDNEALLLCYVRFIRGNCFVDEMLFARSLQTDTKGESTFRVVETFFTDKEIPMANIIACATDGAPSMVGRQRGFISYLKRAVPGVFVIHCVIHRHHLAAKNLSGKLHESLNTVIKSVNIIKARSLNDRLFRKLCHDNDEDFQRLLLHTEVRGYQKAIVFKGFMNSMTLLEFLETADADLHHAVSEIQHDVAYLTDIFTHLNAANKKMQGNKMTLVKVKSIISTFIAKVGLYRQQLGRREFFHFSCLQAQTPAVSDDLLLVYCEHLTALETDLTRRFEDLASPSIPAWVIDPFTANVADIDLRLQEEMVTLQNNVESRACFLSSGYENLWVAQREQYPELWKVVELLIIAFPTSYLVERGFSAVLQLLTKQCNRLDIVKRGDLRLLLTDIQPKIDELVRAHQAQPSH